MKYKIITEYNNLDSNKWLNFINSNNSGNFFQSPTYYNLILKTPDYTPFLIIIIDEQDNINGSLIGVIQREQGIKGFFSRRAIIYGGPILRNNNEEEALNIILEKLKKTLKNKAIYIEFRNLFDLLSHKKTFEKYNFKYLSHLNYLISLTNKDDVLSKFSSNRIRQIKKAQKAGVTYQVAKNISEVHTFYRILSELYIKKIKKPLPPFEFFENFFIDNVGIYLLIFYQGKIIGGMMCPMDDKKIYEWYICGLDKEYQNVNPSVFATFSAIDYGLGLKLKYFDFLGAGNPKESYGVREFKSRFGGDLVNFGRYKLINNKSLYAVGFLAMQLLKLKRKF